MFANPIMLVGLSVAVLPIVVHLLSRARYRSVDWGAMMFLDGATASQSSRKFHQWFLLLIRALIVALLAVALARPEVRGKFASAASNRPGVAVILFDCSASMGFDENGQSRLDLAREAAKQLLSLHRGDRVSLVLMGSAQQPGDRLPTGDLWDVGRRIESAQTSFVRADVAQALGEALEAITPARPSADASSGRSADKLLATFYIVTDRQAANWNALLEGGEGWSADWRQRLEQAGVVGRLVCIPVGSAQSDNVVVRSIELLNGPAIVGQPVELEVKVQNHGAVQWAGLPLLVTADRRPVFNQKVNLAPESVSAFRVTIPTGFPEAGTHVVTAEVNRPPPAAATPAPTPAPATPPSGLTEDDKFDLVVDVKDPIRVLVVTGDEPPDRAGDAADQPRSAGDYVSAALAPFKSAGRKTPADPCSVTVVSAEQWAGPTIQVPTGKKNDTKDVRLATFQAVVLAGLEQFSDAQAVALEQFVYEGGGLLIAPGELSRPAAYDSAFYREGAGILPASLDVPTPYDWSEQTTLLGFEANHPVWKFLGGRPDALLPVTIGRYFPVERIGSQAKVLMRYGTGEPFLIESVSGSQRRGRVLLMTTSLDADWSTLPMTSFYLPMLQSAVRYIGEGAPRKFNLSPGDPIELPVDEAAEGWVVRVKPPDAPEERASETSRIGGQALARFAETETPGLYIARLIAPGSKPVVYHYTVTPPRDESNTTSLTAADWRSLETQADVGKLDPTETPITSATALPAPLELWPIALGVVLLLALLELKLARKWSQADQVVE